MDASAPQTLLSRTQTRLDTLQKAPAGTFHDSIRLFFTFVEQHEPLEQIVSALLTSIPSANAVVDRYLTNSDVVMNPQTEQEAAALGAVFLRMVAESPSTPRMLYEQVFWRDNDRLTRLPNIRDDEENALKCVKDRFLEPFRVFVLESLGSEVVPDKMRDEVESKTGLLTHAAFERDFSLSWSKARIAESSLSLLMIDLDHFKSVNDTHGHLIGDEVLKDVAKIIQRTVEGRGKAYRWGGEEFAVLLENHTASEAVVLAERLRLAISGFPASSLKLTVTASIGVAESEKADDVSDKILKKADTALYDAKNFGRDLVRIFGESPPDSTKPSFVAPPRKLASQQGPFDEHQRAEIRRNYFQSGIARCPFDSALLEIRAEHILGEKTLDLIVDCPMCGANDWIFGPK